MNDDNFILIEAFCSTIAYHETNHETGYISLLNPNTLQGITILLGFEFDSIDFLLLLDMDREYCSAYNQNQRLFNKSFQEYQEQQMKKNSTR